MSGISICECGKTILWANFAGDNIPLDHNPVIVYVPVNMLGKQQYQPVTAHLNHFVTCPLRDKFRRKG